MMCPVSGPSEANGRVEVPEDRSGVLANLPRTRPQRASARRAASRGQSAEAKTAAAGNGDVRAATTTRKSRAKSGTSGARPAKRAASAKPDARTGGARAGAMRSRREERVPRQGFACEEESAVGAVAPPGGTEFVSTAAEIISELAKAGISGGERLLRDILSRLPG